MWEQQQINTLLNCMGPDAEDILQTTRISLAERDKYDSVIERFDKHFSVRKNVIMSELDSTLVDNSMEKQGNNTFWLSMH